MAVPPPAHTDTECALALRKFYIVVCHLTVPEWHCEKQPPVGFRALLRECKHCRQKLGGTSLQTGLM